MQIVQKQQAELKQLWCSPGAILPVHLSLQGSAVCVSDSAEAACEPCFLLPLLGRTLLLGVRDQNTHQCVQVMMRWELCCATEMF